MSETLCVGSLAYLDTFDGLIPARVVSIKGESGPASTRQTVKLKLTASRRGWRVCETIETSGLHAVPRKAVRFRKYGTRIQFYNVEAV